jgi:hypothetical protein
MKTVAVAVLAALIATPALAAAGLPVSSAPVVRIALAGKSDAQVATEIKAAANTVCAAASGPCFAAAVREADSQYAAIKRARVHDAAVAQLSKIEVVRDDRATVRVKIAGLSPQQIDAQIAVAAHSVCRAIGAGDFRACVNAAVRNAHAQLQEASQDARPAQVASR